MKRASLVIFAALIAYACSGCHAEPQYCDKIPVGTQRVFMEKFPFTNRVYVVRALVHYYTIGDRWHYVTITQDSAEAARIADFNNAVLFGGGK